MRVLVTGVNGQLGHDVMLELKKRIHDAVGSGNSEEYTGEDEVKRLPYIQMDTAIKDSVFHAFSEVKPDAVIHCAAWTAVDAAEDAENRDKVYLLNAKGPEYIAEACRKYDAKLAYLSTDYVFNGQGTQPWKPDDELEPLNYYGFSKMQGESAVTDNTDRFFIVRTAWLYGSHGNNFVKTMLCVGKTHETVRVVMDQIGTPTYCRDLARLLVDMIETEKYGYYHATNEGGFLSWYDFAREIFRLAEMKTEVLPISTAEYGVSKAVRPFNSRLDKSKLREQGFEPLPDWRDALTRYLEETGYGTDSGRV